MLRRFFTKGKLKPGRSLLRAQIALVIKTFLAVRGLDWLLKPETTIVMRADYETFVTQDIDQIDNRESILAIVYLKDIGCYQQFKTIQGDQALRAGELGQIALDYLADQLARRLLDEAATAAQAHRHSSRNYFRSVSP